MDILQQNKTLAENWSGILAKEIGELIALYAKSYNASSIVIPSLNRLKEQQLMIFYTFFSLVANIFMQDFQR